MFTNATASPSAYDPCAQLRAAVLAEISDTLSQTTPSGLVAVKVHAQLFAVRMALVDSLRRDPEDAAGREPLWIEHYRLLRQRDDTMARLIAAIESIDEPAPASAMKLCGLKRADGSRFDVPMGRLSWYYGPDLADTLRMPTDEHDRLPDLTT